MPKKSSKWKETKDPRHEEEEKYMEHFSATWIQVHHCNFFTSANQKSTVKKVALFSYVSAHNRVLFFHSQAAKHPSVDAVIDLLESRFSSFVTCTCYILLLVNLTVE